MFSIRDASGNDYDQLHLTDCPFDIRVFNSDFVADNLKWKEGIEPIFMLGEENIEPAKRLADQRALLEQAKKNIAIYRTNISDKEQKIRMASHLQCNYDI